MGVWDESSVLEYEASTWIRVGSFQIGEKWNKLCDPEKVPNPLNFSFFKPKSNYNIFLIWLL